MDDSLVIAGCLSAQSRHLSRHQIKFLRLAITSPWIAAASWHFLSLDRGGLPHFQPHKAVVQDWPEYTAPSASLSAFIVIQLQSRDLPRRKRSSLASNRSYWGAGIKDAGQSSEPSVRKVWCIKITMSVYSPSKLDVLDLQSALRYNNRRQPGTTDTNNVMPSAVHSIHLPNTAVGSCCLSA